MYTAGGHDGIYHLPYWRCNYYPLLKCVLKEVQQRQVQRVLEVGCGTGWFAQMILDRTDCEYRGFDFSEVAVRIAAQNTGKPDRFFVGDALDPAAYTAPYDGVVCTEVLEHIRDDQRVVSMWQRGIRAVCSVPNFDAATHERFFASEQDVRERYGEWLDIDWIRRVKRPMLSDLGWRSRLRHMVWSRYRPRQMLYVLGMTDFDAHGGWFVFSGTRR
jgi:SAM-dependent methyltransferase